MHYFAKAQRRALLVTLLLFVLATASIAGTAPKNVILLIGDGMGFGHVSAAKFAAAEKKIDLALDTMPVTGFAMTHPYDKVVTDSAASGTALATGHKTKNGAIGVLPDDTRLRSILEVARDMGKSTGVVSNDSITSATPAAFVAHVPNRSQGDDIAAQMVASRVNVILGGGKSNFLPKGTGGSRGDGRDLAADARKRGYDVVFTAEEMKDSTSERILGLFSDGGMSDNDPVPTNADMLQRALASLSTGSRGFFVMIESSGPDHGGHGNNVETVLNGVRLLDEALSVALDFATNNPDTLIIVTADHETGGLAVQNVGEEKPELGFSPQWTGGGHTGNMVPIYAYGPGAERFMGTHQNTDIPRIIAELWGQKLN